LSRCKKIFAEKVSILRLSRLCLKICYYGVLLWFVQNEKSVVSAEYLCEKIWKAPLAGGGSAVKNAVSRLRKKTESGGYTITPRCGYDILILRI
jgi:DNA-binding response OmpR family regulator